MRLLSDSLMRSSVLDTYYHHHCFPPLGCCNHVRKSSRLYILVCAFFSWWVSTEISTRWWWFCHCLKCQACKKIRAKASSRPPNLSLPLPNSPTFIVSVSCFQKPPPIPARSSWCVHVLVLHDPMKMPRRHLRPNRSPSSLPLIPSTFSLNR